jgi:hypothetical protein
MIPLDYGLAFILVSAVGAPANPPRLQVDTEVSSTGHYRLFWEPGEVGTAVELQESLSPGFDEARTVYRGPQSATVLSGRRDNTYHYRLRRDAGPWTDTVTVTVQHHDLTDALIYMAVGLVVFLATATLIVCGHIAHRRGESDT